MLLTAFRMPAQASSSTARSRSAPSSIPRADWLVCLVVVILTGWAYYTGVAATSRGLTSIGPHGYYGLQTEAFRLGQLHLALTPDPRLLALENPYAGPQGVNRPHDMTFYKGKFYLYYGVTPVLLVYLPWRLLTGTYLVEMAGMVLMLWIGVTAGSCWLTALKRRYFPGVSPWWLAAMLLTFAFGTPLFFLAQNSTFYAVPIAGAFCCLALALVGLDQALKHTAVARQMFWLAVASLAWGLAAGSRPTYVFGLPLLGGAALWLWWQTGAGKRWRWSGLRLIAAAVIPAAIIGLGLLTYNYLRFDDPTDFGMDYTMQTNDVREMHLVGLDFVPKNIQLYLFEPATWVRYFPFFATGERPYGVLRYVPWLWIGWLFPLTLYFSHLRDRRWIWAGLTAGGAALANFAFLTIFAGGEARYFIDFAPLGFLAACLPGLALLQGLQHRAISTMFRNVVTGGLGALLGATLFCGLMLGISQHHDREAVSSIARSMNLPISWWERLRPESLGPLHLKVRFPADRTGHTEPLLSSGGVAGTGDIVAVTYLDESHLKLRYFHLGLGGPATEPIPYQPGIEHDLVLELGLLYPPAEHPIYAGWTSGEIGKVRRHLSIKFDGVEVLSGSAPSYFSTPGLVQLGRTSIQHDVSEREFSGEIVTQKSLGVTRLNETFDVPGTGPVRLKVIFPELFDGPHLPLVATGKHGAGDLIYLQIMAPGRAVIGHDNWGSPATDTKEFSYTPGETQIIEIEMGSLYPPDAPPDDPSLAKRLRVTVNGEVLYDFDRPFYPSTRDQVEFGYNTIDADGAKGFPGRLLGVERIAPAANNAIAGETGLLRLTLNFPREFPAANEPLVVTGTPGQADIVFVKYGPDQTLQLGFDHWGVGLALSDPIKIDPSVSHQLEVRMASLADSGASPQEIPTEIRLNGELVLQPPYIAYPAPADQRHIGKNVIGASTCTAEFTGQVILVDTNR